MLDDELLERPALQVLHGDVVGAFRLPPVVYLDDIRVVEARCAAGFATETLHELLVMRKARGEDLDSDLAAEQAVVRQIDVGHASAAQFPNELVTIVEHASHQDPADLRHRCVPIVPRSAPRNTTS